MTRYLIESNDFRASITETSDKVTEASSNLDWAVGLDFGHVRDYCAKKGWFVIPIVPEQAIVRPTQVLIGGLEYHLKWVADILVRVTLHDDLQSRDLSFDELPQSLKNII